MITSLEVEISDDPVSGLKRKLIHHRLGIGTDLNMTHYRKIVYFEKLQDGSYGRPILQVIAEDDTMTPERKRKLSEQYAPQYFFVSTENSYVNPANGQFVEKVEKTIIDENGNEVTVMDYPDGSIQELAFWQSLPIAFIQPTPTTNSEVVYSLIKISMKSADNNGMV